MTTVDRDFDAYGEGQKIFEADGLLIQFLAQWMNLPWQMKRDQDEALPDPRLNGGNGPSHPDVANSTAEADPASTKPTS